MKNDSQNTKERRKLDEAIVLGYQYVWFRALSVSMLAMCALAGVALIAFAWLRCHPGVLCMAGGAFAGFAVAALVAAVHYIRERRFTRGEGV